jgi:hypothetical protein
LRFKWYWCLLLIPAIPLILAGDRFIVPSGTSVSDIMVTHYPNLLLIQRSLMDGNGLPLWSPLILGGYPFAANPLSTLWYPPAWLALIFPLPFGINLVMVLHMLLGCAGMAFFLNKQQLKKPLVWLGAVLYGLLPAGFSHIIGGHFTWVCASAWLPWLFSSAYIENKFILKKIVLSAAFIGLMMLADMRFAAYGFLIWSGQNIFISITERQDSNTNRFKKLIYSGLSILLGIGISAVVWLPLMEYSSLSTRSMMTIKDAFYLSLPLFQIFGFIIPGKPQTIEWVIYIGIGLIIPCWYSFGLIRKHKNLIFWWLVGILCLLWSLGETNLLNQYLVNLPGLSLMRVPARGIFFLSFSLLIISMIALDKILDKKFENLKLFRLGILGIFVLSVMLQIGTIFSRPESLPVLTWHVLFTLILSSVILLFSYQKINSLFFIIIFSVVIISDLCLSNWGLVGYRSQAVTLAEGGEESKYLNSRGSDFRVFSPSYSIPQQTAARAKLELVDGIDPLQLTSFVNYVNQAISHPLDGYSVTLPAFATGNPKIDNIDIQPDAESLGILNVKYMVTAFPLNVTGWTLEKRTKENYIYSSQSMHGWAWMEMRALDNSVEYKSINSISRKNNEIVIEATGPGTLVLSEVNYPGWKADIDGQPTNIITAHSILRSVSIPDGLHLVHINFVPTLLITGGIISLLTILLCLTLVKIGDKR